MRILAVGDIVGSSGADLFCSRIGEIKSHFSADMVIVNGENAAPSGTGININAAKSILAAGADVITTGNHAFHSRDYTEAFESIPALIRPLNFGERVPGRGAYVCDMGRYSVCVINLIGLVYMEPFGSFFDALDSALAAIKADIYIVDMHAEATAEKAALARYADGSVSAVFGTHTHIPTADERILPKGTGFITDIGMTGAIESILGVVPEDSIKRQRLRVPVPYTVAGGECALQGVLFDINEKTGLCTAINRIYADNFRIS